MRVASMSWTQVAERLHVDVPPPLLLPLGAIEAHGPHLPLDTDTIIAERLADEAITVFREAHKMEALRAPSVPVTTASWAANFPGTVSLSPEGARIVLRDGINAMFRAGAKRLVLVNLHFDPDHLKVLQEVVQSLQAGGHPGLVFPNFTRRDLANRIGGEFLSGACHGGQFETSMVLSADAKLVAPIHKVLPRLDIDLAAEIKAGKKSFKEVGMDKAYCGDPSSATAEEGARLYRLLGEMLVEISMAEWDRLHA